MDGRAALDGSRAVLCLLGLRCVGKSTVGAALGRELDMPFHDLDHELASLHEREAGRDPRAAPHAGDLLESLGLAAFRALEERALREQLALPGPRVLATGGGCVETASVRELLSSSATCVWLRAPIADLQARLRADPSPRPSLLGGDPAEELPHLAARRDPWYGELAQLEVDCGGREPDAIVAQLRERLAELPWPRMF